MKMKMPVYRRFNQCNWSDQRVKNHNKRYSNRQLKIGEIRGRIQRIILHGFCMSDMMYAHYKRRYFTKEQWNKF